MPTLIALRFIMGLGLGAEIVVGYSTMTEFAPPRTRGKWLAFMAFVVVAGFPATAVLGTAIIPTFGWRPMFVIAGIGALIVWYLRKRLPESRRWLETRGRDAEAEALLQAIEREAADGRTLPQPAPTPPLPAVPFSALFSRSLLPRVLVGSVTLITTNTLIFGFVNWIPTFFVQQGLSITRSFAYAMVIALGAPLGCALGAFSADRLGRRACIIGASVLTIVMGGIYPFVAEPVVLLGVGLLLIVGIYILTSILYGVYTSELFPTEVRLRANGICNMFGRGTTIVTPFIVVALFRTDGVAGVLALMIGLLIVQIIVVARWGIEPAKRGLEELDADGAERATRQPAPV
jgi:MFS transporter, putative metabolite:H+ symporter